MQVTTKLSLQTIKINIKSVIFGEEDKQVKSRVYICDIIILVVQAFRMLCGCDQINFCRQLYTSNDSVTFGTALSSVQNQEGQNLSQNIYFDNSRNPHSSPPSSGTSFSATYNKILKQVILESNDKQLGFWYGIHDEIKIIKGDVIRAGKAILYVHDIFPVHEFQAQKPKTKQKLILHKDETCRICFSSQQTVENPLLSLCSCLGSVKFMHLDCYREWYHTKLNFFNSHKITYFQIRNVRCQICKAKIPFSVQKNKIQYTLLDYKRQFRSSYDRMGIYFPEDGPDLPVNLPDDSIISSSPNSLVQFNSNQENAGHENNQADKRKQKSAETGLYILLRSQKLSDRNDDIVQAILVKLGPDYMVSFGNESGTSNIIIKNGQTCSLHMSLSYVDGSIYLSNFSEGLGTFLKMRKNVEYEFIGKDGVVIDQQNKQLIYFKQKPWFFKFLQPEKKFRVTYTEKLPN